MDNLKKALVTGASEGIGRAFAKRLAGENYAVTAVARNEGRLKELLRELNSGVHSCLVADLSTQEGVDKIYNELTANHYDLLINNAGMGIYSPFYKTDLPKLMSMMRLNCEAVITLAHAYLNKAKEGDALINVSSALAFLPFPKAGLYAATKAFVTSFSESLWFEQKERGIYVMGLCPGITATNFHKRSGGADDKIPPRSMTQSPEKVVDTAMLELKKRRKPTVISSANKFGLSIMPRILTRKNLVSIMGKNT